MINLAVIRQWLVPIARLAFSILLLVLLIRGLDLDGLRQTWRDADVALVAAATLVLALAPLASAPRWQAILRQLGHSLPLGTLTRSLYIGAMYSQVLPSTVGGDVWRIWACKRSGMPLATATYSIMIERLAGLSAAVACFGVSFPWLMARAGDDPARWALSLALVACIGLVAATIGLGLFAPRLASVRALAPFAGLGAAVATVGRSNQLLLILFATAAAGQAVAIIAFYLLARSIGAPLGMVDCAATLAPALLIALMPISFGGWGIREGAFVMILKFYDVPGEQALTLSVLFGAALLAASFPGLLLWWRESKASTPSPRTLA